MTDHLLALSSDLGRFLLQSGQSLATAESCTGGLIAATLTEVAGSSGWFGWGVVSYANAAKMQLLAVQPETLHDHGAVSEAVVRQMATGVHGQQHLLHKLVVSSLYHRFLRTMIPICQCRHYLNFRYA